MFTVFCCFLLFDFLSYFGCLFDLPPFLIVFGWLFLYFLMGFGYESPKKRHYRGHFLFTVKTFLLVLIKLGREAFSSSRFLSLSLIFSYFFTIQTPSEDDNSEDEWLEPLSP